MFFFFFLIKIHYVFSSLLFIWVSIETFVGSKQAILHQNIQALIFR